MRLVERAACPDCGASVLAGVTLAEGGTAQRQSLTCPECGATWTPERAPGLRERGAPAVVPDGFNISVHVGEGHAIVSVSGEIDLATAVQLRDAGLDALGVEPTHVVVDMSDVTFMDSTGLGVLVLLRRKARTRRCRLSIVSSKSIETVLYVSGLDQAFNVRRSVDEALAAPDETA